ncbi:MAG: hypothetical protein AAGF97_06860 [Planctomycetota bacterium]
MTRWNQRLLRTLIAGSLVAVSATWANADSLLVNFTADLTPASFVGPNSINPYVPGNALNLFIALSGETDVLRADGQFYIKDWDGSDGTFRTNVDPGTRFLFHSPLLERIEADTWRAEGPSDHGTLNGLGDPIVQRRKFLLPTNSTFGEASVTIENGVPTSVDYVLDFSQPGIPGFENTALDGITFNEISLSSDAAVFDPAQTFSIGTDDDAVPYGLDTQLSLGAYPPGLLNGTVMDTTRGMLRNEILNNSDENGGNTPNISADGRLDGGLFPSGDTPIGDVYLEDPFLNETGTLYVFNASDLTIGVNAVPEPAAATLVFSLCIGMLMLRRGR